MNYLLILASTPHEVNLLVSHLQERKALSLGEKQGYQGSLSHYEVQLLITGIGPVNVAQSLTASIYYRRPDLVWLIGCGGAYPKSGLKIGDFALASEEIWAEAGAYTEAGWKPLDKIDLPYLIKGSRYFYNCFPMSKRLNSLLARCILSLLPNCNIKIGPFLTTDATTGDIQRLSVLRQRFFGVCENMEGAAVAQVCTIYGIPCLELRCISNLVGNYDRESWEITWAAEACQKLVLNLLERGSDWWI